MILRFFVYSFHRCLNYSYKITFILTFKVLSMTIETDSFYLENRCIEICTQKYFIYPECQCQDPLISLYDNNLPICQTISQLQCIQDYRKIIRPTFVQHTCKGICPSRCSTYTFYPTLSTGSYPTEYYTEELSSHGRIARKINSFL